MYKEIEEEKRKAEKLLKKRDPLLRELYYEKLLKLYGYIPEKLETLVEEIKADPYIRPKTKESFLESIEKRLEELKMEKKKKLEYVV